MAQRLRPAYPIRTERLLLRPLTSADTDALVAYRGRADVCRYVPFEPMDRDRITEMMGTRFAITEITDEGQALSLGVEVADTGVLAGDVQLAWVSREHRSGEIGYMFHPGHVGRGYATEAMRAVLALAFDGLGLHRVVARIDERNDASARVARRLGMRQEARLVENEWLKGEWTTEIDFGLLASEWRAGSGGALL